MKITHGTCYLAGIVRFVDGHVDVYLFVCVCHVVLCGPVIVAAAADDRQPDNIT